MHDAVRAIFRPFSEGCEGLMRAMYLDMHRDREGRLDPLVTTGVGNLIDASPQREPWAPAMRWPWRLRSSGRLAMPDEIRDEWQRIKAHVEMAPRGARARDAFGRLELDDAGIDALFAWRLAEDEKVLRGRIRNYDTIPADAQLALHSMAWGMGPWFKYPRCLDAVLNERFAEAAIESHCPSFNADRNAHNKLAFLNAHEVAKRDMARDVVHWPGALS